MASYIYTPPTPAVSRKEVLEMSLPTSLNVPFTTSATTSPFSSSSCSPLKCEQQQQPKFKCVKKLGHGAYANVWLALDQITGEHSAVKVIPDERNHAAALYEYNLGKKLDHPNIIKTKGCFKTQTGSVMMVQEYACNGDLFSKVEAAKRMSEPEVRHYFSQLVHAVKYLHDNNIAHRDIKPENVVINEDNVAKLCDFGMAEIHGNVVTHGSGTIPYISPEVLHASSGLIAHTCHDMWSLGVVLYVLLTGDFPWQKAHAHDVDYYTYASGDLSRGSWRKFSPQLLHLFSRIFVHPNSRITAAELLSCMSVPFFARQSRKTSVDSDDSASTMSLESTFSLDSNSEAEPAMMMAVHTNSRTCAQETMSY
jgi:serine/threonine protein kinase